MNTCTWSKCADISDIIQRIIYAGVSFVQCGAVIPRSIFSKILKIDTP